MRKFKRKLFPMQINFGSRTNKFSFTFTRLWWNWTFRRKKNVLFLEDWKSDVLFQPQHSKQQQTSFRSKNLVIFIKIFHRFRNHQKFNFLFVNWKNFKSSRSKTSESYLKVKTHLKRNIFCKNIPSYFFY